MAMGPPSPEAPPLLPSAAQNLSEHLITALARSVLEKSAEDEYREVGSSLLRGCSSPVA